MSASSRKSMFSVVLVQLSCGEPGVGLPYLHRVYMHIPPRVFTVWDQQELGPVILEMYILVFTTSVESGHNCRSVCMGEGGG